MLEETVPSTPPQTSSPPPPSPKPAFHPLPKWMAKLPSNRAKKTAPSCPIPTPSPQTVRLSTDSCVPSHVESSSKGFLLTRSLSANVQAKAILARKASSAAMTRMKSLQRKYGGRAPPYMRELSAVFSDHKEKERSRSRTKRTKRSDEGHEDGEREVEGPRLVYGHGWEDKGRRDLSLEKEEESEAHDMISASVQPKQVNTYC